MNRFVLPRIVNWGCGHIFAINDTGSVCAYGSKSDIFLIANSDQGNPYAFSNDIISKAHKNRITALVFSNLNKSECLVSCGDDGAINVWNLNPLVLSHKCVTNPSGDGFKLVDLDVIRQATSTVVAVGQCGQIVKYNLERESALWYNIGLKVNSAFCISACPHRADIVAIGLEQGLLIVYSLQGTGKVIHKLRPHETDVVSLSWCPVAYNVFEALEKMGDKSVEEDFKNADSTLLLASASRDCTIYISKAGANGYCETFVTIPSTPLAYCQRSTLNITGLPDHFVHIVEWISPTSILVTSVFGEILKLDLSRSFNKRSGKARKSTCDVKFLCKYQNRCITSLAIPYNFKLSERFVIWCASGDRTIACCRYDHGKIEHILSLPTINGIIYDLAWSPVNPDLLAIATADGKIYVWTITSRNTLDIMVLSKKINDKVFSIRWHPRLEGVLAFGTGQGRVGIFDISQGGNVPRIMKPYHSKPIYQLHWIPNNITDDDHLRKDYRLFAVGNGEVVQYNPSNEVELPVSLNYTFDDHVVASSARLNSELCYDEGRQVIVTGLQNGNIHICRLLTNNSNEDEADDKSGGSAASLKVTQVIESRTKKSVLSMVWHPRKVTNCSQEVSPYKNWLAVASEHVCVYDIDPTGERVAETVASHTWHSDRVTQVCWSPHINGRLLSVSADQQAIIWDVPSGSIIGCFSKHVSPIFCAAWHPFNPDLAITGSVDNTCRIWSVAHDTTVNFQKKSKTQHSRKLVPKIIALPSHTTNTSGGGEKQQKQQHKKKPQSMFPSLDGQMESFASIETMIYSAISEMELKKRKTSNGSALEEQKLDNLSDRLLDCEVTVEEKEKFSYSDLFGDDTKFEAFARHEEQVLDSVESKNAFLWSLSGFEVKNKILDAMKKYQLTEYTLVLAATISPKFFKDVCLVYIEQLIRSDEHLKAATLMLAMNKYRDAITMLCEKKYFKEALVIARRSSNNSEDVGNILRLWIQNLTLEGHFRLSAQCYLFLDEYEKAAQVLTRSKQIKDVMLGAKLLRYYSSDNSLRLAVDCFKQLLVTHLWEVIDDLLISFPSAKYLEPWYIVAKILYGTRLTSKSIYKWFLGEHTESSLIDLQENFPSQNVDYVNLCKAVPENTFNMDYGQLLMHASGHLTIFLVGWKETVTKCDALRHLLKAVVYSYNYRIMNPVKFNAFHPLIQLLMLAFPKGPFNLNESIFNDVELNSDLTDLLTSLKVYLGECCCSWIVTCNPSNSKLENKSRSELDIEINLNPKLLSDGSNMTSDESERCELELGEEHHQFELPTIYEIFQHLNSLFDIYLEIILDESVLRYNSLLTKFKMLEARLSNSGSNSVEEGIKSNLVGEGIKSNSAPIDFVNGSAKESHADSSNNNSGDQTVLEKNSESRPEVSCQISSDAETSTSILEIQEVLSSPIKNDHEKIVPAFTINNIIEQMKFVRAQIEQFELNHVAAPNSLFFSCRIRTFLTDITDADHNLQGILLEKINAKCPSFSFQMKDNSPV